MKNQIDVKNFRETLDNNFVLVLTSNSIERKAVNKVVDNLRSAKFGRDTSGCDLGLLDGIFVLHVCGESGISKPLSIGRIATELLVQSDLPKPALVILCGFCWGDPSKVRPLDIIISNIIYSSNYQIATENGVAWKSEPFTSKVDIDTNFISDINHILKHNNSRVFWGAMVSLEMRLEDKEFRDNLIRENPQIIGGEMEAFGFVPSCDVPWLVIKAVSDLGDADFARDKQPQTAVCAANTLQPLISILKKRDYFSDIETAESQKALLDLLIGDTVVLHAADITADSLNDHLNNNIGSIIEYKLRRYSSEQEYGSEFVYDFCDLILELMQNSLRHGGANMSSIQFTDKSIIFKDDGNHFNPKDDLFGRNGGARAWKKVIDKYSETICISINTNKGKTENIYKFALKLVSKRLANARTKCQIKISNNSIGRAVGRSEALLFDENCDALYLDANLIRMSSRRISVLKAIKPLVNSGKKIYIACRSQDQATEFRSELQELSISDVTVLIANN